MKLIRVADEEKNRVNLRNKLFMDADELLRRYASGERDFKRANLRGCCFKGQCLTGADFSYADIRGANFSNASLVGANFSQVRAGPPLSFAICLVTISFLLSALSGLLFTIAGAIAVFWFLGFSLGLKEVDPLVFTGIAVVFAAIAATADMAVAVGVTKTVGGSLVGVAVVAVAPFVFLLVFIPSAAAFLFSPTAVEQDLSSALAFVGGAVDSLPGLLTITLPVAVWSALTGKLALGGKRYAWMRSLALGLATVGCTTFRDANLSGANFTNANLKYANFKRACFVRVNLTGATLTGAFLPNGMIHQ